MFVIKKPQMTNKTFRLPDELIVRLQVISQQKDISMNNLVIQCCEYALDRLDKGNNKEKETKKES